MEAGLFSLSKHVYVNWTAWWQRLSKLQDDRLDASNIHVLRSTFDVIYCGWWNPCNQPSLMLIVTVISWWWWRWFNERTVPLRTLPLVPSPTGLHPARRDSGVCMCNYVCPVWSVFPTAFIVPPTSLVECVGSYTLTSPLYSIWTWNEDRIKFNPDGGSNPGRQIDSPTL